MMGWVAGTCGRWRPWRTRSIARAWPRGQSGPLCQEIGRHVLVGDVAPPYDPANWYPRDTIRYPTDDEEKRQEWIFDVTA